MNFPKQNYEWIEKKRQITINLIFIKSLLLFIYENFGLLVPILLNSIGKIQVGFL